MTIEIKSAMGGLILSWMLAMPLAQAETVAYEEFKTLDQMRQVLSRENFDEARPMLEKYLNHVDNPYSPAGELSTCFFENLEIVKTLDRWVQEHPDDHMPYTLRGFYRFLLGMDARGGASVDKIPDEQWQAVGERFGLALEDIKHSLELKQDQLLLYDSLLDIARIMSWDDAETRNILAAGLRYFPDSYMLRATFIYGLTPRWGGSYEAMQAFVDESRPAMERNPAIRALEGASLLDQARVAWHAEEQDVAMNLLTRALEYGEDEDILSTRADLYYIKQDYAHAIEDQTRVIALDPLKVSAYAWRAIALFKTGQTEAAMDDIRRSEHLQWNSWRLANAKGYISEELMKVGKTQCDDKDYTAAEQTLSKAIEFNSENKKAYYWRARVYLFQNKLEQAQRDYQEVLRIDPNHKEAAARWNEIYLRLQHEGAASQAPAN